MMRSNVVHKRGYRKGKTMKLGRSGAGGPDAVKTEDGQEIKREAQSDCDENEGDENGLVKSEVTARESFTDGIMGRDSNRQKCLLDPMARREKVKKIKEHYYEKKRQMKEERKKKSLERKELIRQ
jgi:hypothetical protein